MRRRLVGEAHPAYICGLIDLAAVIRTQDDEAQAEGLLGVAMRKRKALEPALPWLTACAELELGACIAAQKRDAEVERLLESASQTLSRELGEDDPRAREAKEVLKEFRRARAGSPSGARPNLSSSSR